MAPDILTIDSYLGEKDPDVQIAEEILGSLRTISGLDLFIRNSREKHGSRYDYSKVRWETNKSKVTIVCPEHGEFTQRANDHSSQGKGCPICAAINHDVVYIWHAKDFTYKIGVTSSSRGYQRIAEVSRAHSLEAEVVLYLLCRNPASVERVLLDSYSPVSMGTGDGYTEFRHIPNVTEAIRLAHNSIL